MRSAAWMTWFFQPFTDRSWRGFLAWAGLLWLVGLLVWGVFLNWGRGPYAYHDWLAISLPRMTFIQNAVRQGVLPLHIADAAPLNQMTDRFMGIPDVILSPQVLLLHWMKLRHFILFNVWLVYSVGFAGLLVFARRYHLSPLALCLLALLFNFNGHLVAHLSVGHLSWVGYFLYSWLLLLVFDLFEGRSGWGWVLAVAGVMLVMVLQGGYHQMVYGLFLLAGMVLVRPRQWRWIVAAGLASAPVNALRLLPAVIHLGQIEAQVGYAGGYLDVGDLLRSLLFQLPPNDLTMRLGGAMTLGSWELSLYLGVPGTLFVAGFGVWLALRRRQGAGSFAGLLLPAGLLALLSLDQVYAAVRALAPFPPLSGERVAARMVSMAFVLALAVAVIEFQRWLERRSPSPGLWAAAGLFLLALGHDLWQNLRYWQVTVAEAKFGSGAFDAAHWVIANRADPAYLAALWAGAAISLLTLVALGWLAWRERKQRVKDTPGTPHATPLERAA